MESGPSPHEITPQLRHFLSMAPFAVVIHDGQRIIWVNDAALETFGYDDAELVGMSVLELVHPEDRPRVLQRVRDAAGLGLAAPPIEERLLRKDGEVIVALVAAIPGALQNHRAVFVTGTNVTAIVEARRQALLAKQKAEEALRVRDEFLSIAAHELYTPLTSFHLAIERLQRSDQLKQSEKDQRLLALLRRQGDRLVQLVSDLLDVGRIQSGRLELELEEIDLCELIRDVLNRYALAIERAGCRVELNCSGPERGVWDARQLDQVFTNLLSNAIKFGAGKPIHVSVMGTPESVRITVRDHGIGITAERLPLIFDRFARAVPRERYGGLGIGLFIVKSVVERHGGRVWAENAADQGACFTIELPRQTSPAAV